MQGGFTRFGLRRWNAQKNQKKFGPKKMAKKGTDVRSLFTSLLRGSAPPKPPICPPLDSPSPNCISLLGIFPLFVLHQGFNESN
jgi:hypothetical protein